MKLYSNLTKKFYEENERELLLKEEAEIQEKQKKAELAKRAESAEKKVLASKVDEAEALLKKAYADEATAKKKVAEIFDKSQSEAAAIITKGNEEAKAILDEAKKKISDAQKIRYEAIKNFNEKYGTYTRTITGEDAKDEYEAMVKMLDSIMGNWHINNNWMKSLFK